MNKPLIKSLGASLCAALLLMGCSDRDHEHAEDGSHPPAAEVEAVHGHGTGG